MEQTYIKGQQIWGQPGHQEVKRNLVKEAYHRAELKFRAAFQLSQEREKS